MNRGRFCERLFPMSFLSSMPQSNQEIIFGNKFSIPLCLSYENCKWPCRNPSKCENCFAMFLLVCNFHISLQFSFQFAILTFGVLFLRGRLQFSDGFAIFISVCNSHVTTPALLTYAALYGFPCNYELELITPRQPRFSVEETKKN